MTNAEMPTPETLFGPDADLATPQCSEWLAAYALGLAHTTTSQRDAVDELLATAGGSHQLLREACERLARLTHVDHDLLTRTGQLLTAAVAATSSAARRKPGRPGRAGRRVAPDGCRAPTDDHVRRPDSR